MISFFRTILLTTMIVFSSVELRAGFIIEVGNGIGNTFAAGSTIRVPFSITATGGDQIAGYQIAVDLGATGFGGTSGFSNIHADFSSKQIGDFAGTDDGTQSNGFNIDLARDLNAAGDPFTGNVSFDYVVSNGQGSNATPGTSFRMFELVFKANTAGTFAVNAVVRTDPNGIGIGDVSSFTFIGLGPSNYDLDATSITTNSFAFTITGVPEPSSLALVGLVSVGVCLARRRRTHL